MQEFMKEYLRRAFETGALDLGYDREMLVGFLRIFSGEMEATIALEHASDLEEGELESLTKIAAPTGHSVSEHRAWKKSIAGQFVSACKKQGRASGTINKAVIYVEADRMKKSQK